MSKRKTTKKAVSSLIVPKKKPTASTIKKYAGLNGKAAAIKKFGKDAVQKAQFKVDQKAFNVRKNRPKNKNKPTDPMGFKFETPKQKRQMDDDFETRGDSLLIEEPTQKQYDYFDNLSSRIKSAERAARKTGGKVVKAKKGTKKKTIKGFVSNLITPAKKKTKAFINRQKMDILPSKTPKDRSNIKSGVAVKKTSVQEPKGKIKTESPSEKNKTVSKVQKVYEKGGFKTSRVNPKTKKPKVMGPGGRASQGPKQAKAIKKNVVKRDIRRNLKRAAVVGAVGTGLYQLGKGVSKKAPMAATDSSSSGGSYKIKSGDTLSQIAKRRGTTLKALLAANPSIKNANKIRVGQTIKMSKPVKKRKSVYQGLSKSRMSKMAMPKKKKMYGGKVVKRGKGGSVGSNLVAGCYDT